MKNESRSKKHIPFIFSIFFPSTSTIFIGYGVFFLHVIAKNKIRRITRKKILFIIYTTITHLHCEDYVL